MPDFNLDDRLFISHIEDAFSIAKARDIPKFVGFLDERQKAVVQSIKGKSPESQEAADKNRFYRFVDCHGGYRL